MKVKDIMTKDVVYVDKDESLSRVLELMKKYDITKIPVVENKKLIGIITDNLIAYKLGSIRKRGIPASRLHASSVTEKKYKTISPETYVKDILETVGEPGPTMLPVVEKDNRLVGVLTKADLLHLVNSKKPLHSIMQKNLHLVSPDDRVIHARRIMIEKDVARLPVAHNGRLVGIISDIEIAFALADLKKSYSLGRQKHQLDELLVEDVMRTPVIWAEPHISALDAARIMIDKNIGALPLLEKEKIVGIVTRTDLLKTISI
ncbi:MAG: CBS domain-containing protein [Candidatus Thermoplasmatota archaeon]|jgi:CBS domain-containing protein|nr:CBS domain-containing protein [Candidatus Thermoplasmatota archaeon]